MDNVVNLFKGEEQMNKLYSVANYFINRSDDENPMTPLKLQKLCYYAQAWNLAWDNKELFSDDFQAWVHGPANYNLWNRYKGNNIISKTDSNYNINVFNADEIETLDAVWDAYGNFSGKYLEQLTHQEDPWLLTRGDLPEGTPSNTIINKNIIQKYYSNL